MVSGCGLAVVVVVWWWGAKIWGSVVVVVEVDWRRAMLGGAGRAGQLKWLGAEGGFGTFNALVLVFLVSVQPESRRRRCLVFI